MRRVWVIVKEVIVTDGDEPPIEAARTEAFPVFRQGGLVTAFYPMDPDDLGIEPDGYVIKLPYGDVNWWRP